MKSGKFAPNKSAGACPAYKPFHVDPKPQVKSGEGGHDIRIQTMDNVSPSGVSYKGPGKNAN